MKFKNFIYFPPFLFFVFGYYFLHFFLQKNEAMTPNIIGKSLHSGIKLLAENGLSLKLLREQEDLDLPEGIILNQIPKGGQKIKTTQNILVTVSKKPTPLPAPDFLAQNYEDIVKKSAKLGIQVKTFWIKSFYPLRSCVAQYPYAGEKVNDRKIVVYLSAGTQGLNVVPNFRDCKIEQLKNLLKKENIQAEVIHLKMVDSNHNCSECKVVDQKPIPGSIVDLNKKVFIQLQVS